MKSESKFLVNVRLPTTLVERIDFVVRNGPDDSFPHNRSVAILEAVESWLPSVERRLRELGLMFEK